MEVVKQNVAILSNFEVLSLIQDVVASENQKKMGRHQQLATISYEVTKYLEKLPCRVQNETIIRNFLEAVSQFNLTRAEKLELVNHRPTTPVEIHILIEESEERLTEDEVNQLLDIIAEILPDPSGR